MTIVLYSTEYCGKCKILKQKLQKAGIKYESCTDELIMDSKNIKVIPVLEVDNKLMEYAEANTWINERIQNGN